MTSGQRAEQINAHFQNIKSADEYGAEQGILGEEVAFIDESLSGNPQSGPTQNQNLNRNQAAGQKQDNVAKLEPFVVPFAETSAGAGALATQANGNSANANNTEKQTTSASSLESQLLEAFDLVPSAEIVNSPTDLGSGFGAESQMGGESSGFIPASMTAASGESQDSEEMETVLADELASLQNTDTKSTDSAKETTLKVVDSFNRAEPNTNERTENLREIIQGARALVKNGGGQMNLKLTPEGMGEIQLKVAVNKGNVDVQMITNNSETKRHLETAVSDLRNGLAQQKLTLDTVRVDMNGAGIGQEMDMTNSGNHQREMAQEFMQQFRDQNNSFKHAFYTGPSRGTKDPLDRPDVKPEGSNSPRSDGKSKHINVTA
jgi:flagellar hook-length control protein FliK